MLKIGHISNKRELISSLNDLREDKQADACETAITTSLLDLALYPHQLFFRCNCHSCLRLSGSFRFSVC